MQHPYTNCTHYSQHPPGIQTVHTTVNTHLVYKLYTLQSTPTWYTNYTHYSQHPPGTTRDDSRLLEESSIEGHSFVSLIHVVCNLQKQWLNVN